MRTALRSWVVGLLAVACLGAKAQAAMPDWRTVTPGELAMTSEPAAPGSAAVILYMEVSRDDASGREYRYQQIKILTEEGRSYGDIQLAYDKKRESIKSIEARTIRKDGTIVPFTGTIDEKPLASGSQRKLMAKTIPLSGVEVGSIVEVRYARVIQGLHDVRWLLANNLFTREAHYAFRGRSPLRYGTPRGLPPGTEPITKGKNGWLTLQTRNVPAYEDEEQSPPAEEIQYRLDFIYSWDWDRPAKDPEKFWKRYSEEQADTTGNYLVHSSSLKSVVAELAPATDPPETRLRKLYDACVQLRNKSYEPSRSEEEADREDEPSPGNVRDVWKFKYGWDWQINLLYMAMVRQAGFDAAEVWVADRSETFFDPNQMDPGPLETRLIHVKLGGRDLLLSPGTKFLAFGVVPWWYSAQRGLRIQDRAFTWMSIPANEADGTHVRREAQLVLQPDGSLKGTVQVQVTGQEALWRRNRENNEDAAHRRKFLESDLLERLRGSAIIKVTSNPDWDGTGEMKVTYDVTIPGHALRAGDRRLMPQGLFVAGSSSAFKRAERKSPLYFWYPYVHEEDVRIELPPGWHVAELPTGEAMDLKRLTYMIESLKMAGANEAVRVRRRQRMDVLVVPPENYPAIRAFYSAMRSGDEQQVVLSGEGK